MRINWKCRRKSPAFWFGLIGVIVAPILSGLGMSLTDFTSWDKVLEAVTAFVKSPYMIGTVVVAVLSFIGVSSDPTTKGISDSEKALEYEEPNS